MFKKGRLIWDDCIPTRERRPTTEEDIEDDINVEDYTSEERMLNQLLELAGYDEEDLDLDANASAKSKMEELLNCFDDPSDGSPNILYASINGKPLKGSLPYDSLEGLDLETATQEEVVEKVKGEFASEDDDDGYDDDEEDGDEVELKKYNLAVNIRGDDYSILLSTDSEDEVAKAFIDAYQEYGSDLVILDGDGNNDSYDEFTTELFDKAEAASEDNE